MKELWLERIANMNIIMSHCYDFLVKLKIVGGCEALTNFPLHLFQKLHSLELKGIRNLQMISMEHTHNHLKGS